MAEPFTITEHTNLALATIMARKGVDPAAIEAALADTQLIPTGPGTWLAVSYCDPPPYPGEGRGPVPTPDLDPGLRRDTLKDLASVSDQSGGYIVYRFSGPAARTLLQRGAFIDLHPSVFGPGSSAVTVIAHIGVILWQADDDTSFDVALFRSFAGSFRHWVEASANAHDRHPDESRDPWDPQV